MEENKLDKTTLVAHSFADADNQNFFPSTTSVAERLRLSFSLVCKIYGLIKESDLKIDKSVFSLYKFS